MALTYSNLYIEPSRDDSGKVVAITVYELVAWDGARAICSCPSSRLGVQKIQDMLQGSPCRLNWLSVVYSGALTMLDASVLITPDQGTARGAIYSLACGEISIVGNGSYGYGSFSPPPTLINPNYDKVNGDTGADASSESLVMLNFRGAAGAPDNTETTAIMYQLEVIG